MRFGLALTSLCVVFGAPLARAASPDVSLRLVTKLYKSEGYYAQAFQGGRLFEGQDWSADEQYPRVAVFSADGTSKLGEVKLPHSPSHIYPFGDHAVVVVGKSDTDQWRTHFSVISTDGMAAKTTTLPTAYQVDQFAGEPDHLYFTEPGDSKIYQYDRGEVRALAPKIAAPERMVYTDSALYVIQQPDIMQMGNENIFRIDLDSEVATPLFKTNRQGLVDLAMLPDHRRVATSEYLTQQILLVDGQTQSLLASVPVSGHPYGVTAYGSCVVTITEDTKHLVFIDTAAAKPAVYAEWDLSGFGDALKKPRIVSVDQTSGRFFVRSAYPCPSCADTQSSVVVAEQASGDVAKHCLGADQ